MPQPGELQVANLDATFRGVMLPMGLVVDEVRVYGAGARLKQEPFAISLEKPGDVEIEISEAGLAQFLERMAPGGLYGFKVKLQGGKAIADAYVRMILEVPVSAVCTLRIQDGTKLFVDLESVNVLGSGPKALVQKQLDAINPVVDVADFPVRARLESVSIESGKALLKGTLAPR